MPLPPPVIVVPGITATYLHDEYPLPPEIVWSVMTKDYGRSALHPDNPRLELHEPARVASGQIFEIAYRELIEELRHNLSPHANFPVPVYPFGYDWRHPLVGTEAQLKFFIEEVIERTKLMKHYHADGYHRNPKVNLVGHSMGGLVIAGYLQQIGAGAPVDKVVSIAAPFRGSLESVLKISTGMADLGTGESHSREREAARLTPALYHLLPRFENVIESLDGEERDFFNINSWQPGIIETLSNFIRLHGLEPDNTENQASDLFVGLLRESELHRNRLEEFSLEAAGLEPNDWLCIVGVGTKTRVRLQIDSDEEGKAILIVNSEFRVNKWQDEEFPREEWVETGDGTVPFLGAMNNFISIEKVVCVSPDDYGYWEVQDRALSAVAGFHGIMPNMNMLHRLIVRHFTGAKDPRGNTWGRPPPNLPEGVDWDPPLELNPPN